MAGLGNRSSLHEPTPVDNTSTTPDGDESASFRAPVKSTGSSLETKGGGLCVKLPMLDTVLTVAEARGGVEYHHRVRMKRSESKSRIPDHERMIPMTETDLVRKWVEQAVLGLNLCPFAGEHWHAGRVRLTVTAAATEQVLLEDLHAELAILEATDSKKIETTVLIVPNLLHDFSDYNQFLDLADALITKHGWAGRFQIASFHPGYQFAATKPDDPENLTNRSPYPLLHLLRESTVTRALAEHATPDQIPSANIATLRALSEERRQEIFGFPPRT